MSAVARTLQSMTEEMFRLRAEVERLRAIIDIITAPPMTAEEAEAALADLPELDQAEKDAVAAIDIGKIIAYATDPANASPEEMVRRMIESAKRAAYFDTVTLREAEAWLDKRFS